ncbi:MAG TPA: putative porin [Flavobacteriaceae bacterium]|nr:putative porin [Flavobacteriaceae bacterium]
MKKIILCFILIPIMLTSNAQVKKPAIDTKAKINKAINRASDTLTKRMAESDPLVDKTHYTDFKIYDFERDSTIIDTTLTILKDYKFNYLRKDDFELLPFHNQGQTSNRLAYSFDEKNLNPSIGAKAKHFNYYEIEDINYYKVPTPSTELMYRTGMEQGQVLDALLTMNTSPQFNFSFAYKGLRSLGRYRNSLSSQGNFRATFNYQSKNKHYDFRGHYTSQDLMNQENGGLTTTSLAQFLSGDANYNQRGRLDVNLLDAESMLRGKRYFIEQRYHLLRIKSDSLQKSQITLGQTYSYETKHFKFSQSGVSSLFGDALTTAIDDHAYHQQHNTSAFVTFKSPILLGNIKIAANLHSFEYGFKNPVDSIFASLPKYIKDDKWAMQAEWNSSINKIHLKAVLNQQITGDNTTKSLFASATYKKDSVNWAKGFINIYTKTPELNYQLYRSNYKEYNWYHNFSNQDVWNVGFELKSKKWLNANLNYSKIDHLLYFDSTNAAPLQATETVDYLKATIFKGFTFYKFGFENTLMYQKVSESNLISVPAYTSRNTLYYATHLFKGNPLYIQTGVTLKYFSKFYAPAYNPLLGEFTQQNNIEIGNYPTIDIFLNGQIQRTRIYFKIENVTSKISSPNYFSAPNYPSRDFSVRFGLVWNFFI